jgi:hypothetical protein
MSYPLKILACFLLLAFTQKNDAIKDIKPEYLDWKTFKINGQLPLLCNKAELIALLGTADSIKTPNYEDVCASYFDTAFKYLYFRESLFETLGTLAVVSIIDFESSNIKLVSPMITLDKSVTLEKIKRLFPIAVKNAELLEVDKKGKLLCIKLSTSKKETDDAWLLFFRNGKLVRIDYWIPC